MSALLGTAGSLITPFTDITRENIVAPYKILPKAIRSLVISRRLLVLLIGWHESEIWMDSI